MSDLIYRQAVTEDGEPVKVTEGRYSYEPIHSGGRSETWTTRDDLPTSDRRFVSWALILPGDTVKVAGASGTVAQVTYDSRQPVEVELPNEAGSYGTHEAGVVDSFDSADLTLVCGEPSELRKSNPAWRWDR